MASLTHPLLTAFRASKPAFGAWITLPGVLSARTAAASSPHLSWVVLDCEHGAISIQPGAAESAHAIAGLGPAAPTTIVRIPATGACADGSAGWQIKNVLDAGARGVIVPMVSTRAQAESVVAASRFPPRGVRGFGSPFTHLAWGTSAGEYLAQANDAIVVLVQIETAAGVENLDGILSVDGLDGVFIGPYDLSLSLGFPAPSPDPHPEVEKVIQSILASAHAKGKKMRDVLHVGLAGRTTRQRGLRHDQRRNRQHRDGGESCAEPRDRGGNGRGSTRRRLLSGDVCRTDGSFSDVYDNIAGLA